jgi:long-chain acyl-CoA synthetase
VKMSPIQALMHQSQSRPDATAFIFEDEVWTYRRLVSEVERVARGLVAREVRTGDRVLLHMTNRPEMVVAYYACFKIGAIAAPLRTAFKFAELAPLVQRLKPALYIGESDLYDNIAEVDPEILAIDKRFIVDWAAREDGVQPWERLLNEVTGPTLLGSPNSYAPAVLINTSGTTGLPKFVVHTTDTLAESTGLIIESWAMSADEVLVVPLPMAHMSGFISLLTCLQFGTPFVLLKTFDADVVLDTLERYRCTRYIGFPVQYAALVESQRAKPRNLSSLRMCLTGADVCPIDLQERARSVLGSPLYNYWGATEVVGSLSFGLQCGPVVRITKGALIRLVDENGAEVCPGQVGELLIRGRNVFAGYWNDPRATEQSLKGGWYRTGDLMRRGEGDDLWFVGRKKDIIIRGGTNISPVEIEKALVASHPKVKEAAVVGIPDDVLGQRVFGFVSLADGSDETVASEILHRVGERLASYKVPEGLRIVDQLPRNALGKVDRNKLQAMRLEPGKICTNQAEALPSQPKVSDKRTIRRRAF